MSIAIFNKSIQAIVQETTSLWNQSSDIKKVSQDVLSTVEAHSPEKFFDQFSFLEQLSHKNDLKSFYKGNNFSDFSVSLFSNKDFRVEIYFWGSRDTGIHNHPFYGCFYLLEGKTLQNRFKFSQTGKDNDVNTGSLLLTEAKTLTAGQGQLLLPKDELIHNSVHLSKATVSLCIRSHTNQCLQNYNYYIPGLRVLKPTLDESLFQKLKMYNYLFVYIPNNENLLNSIISGMSVAQKVFLFFNRSLLQNYFSPEAISSFLETVDNSIEEIDLANIWIKNNIFVKKLNALKD